MLKRRGAQAELGKAEEEQGKGPRSGARSLAACGFPTLASPHHRFSRTTSFPTPYTSSHLSRNFAFGGQRMQFR